MAHITDSGVQTHLPTGTAAHPILTRLKQPRLLRQAACIDGQWLAAAGLPEMVIADPADGQIVGRVPLLGALEARQAIDAAARALPLWSGLTAKERCDRIERWHDLMIEHEHDLGLIMTAEQGKPLAESVGEIRYAASFLKWFAEEGKRVYGEVIPATLRDRRVLVLKQPIGVCAAITPWNFPSAMITRKAGPALAAGCTVVLKPAPQTPFSALALADLALEAGIPPGALNVVTGDAQAIGTEFTANPIVRKLTFTGSTQVGRQLMAQCAPTLKKVALELGGNAPFIIFDDADLDAAVAGVMASKFRNTGQTCVCANRVYVHAAVYEDFSRKLATAVAALVVGPGLDPATTQGPLISSAALDKVQRHVADAVAKGARLLAGGARHALGGTFYQPTILGDVTADAVITTEETFGPVVALLRFEDDAAVVRLANATEYGLAAYFYSTNLKRVWRTAEQLEYGIVGVNTGAVSTEVAPFGGFKQSGLGREGSHHGLEEFLEIKYVCLAGV